jgi:tetratricopeptide (TPR) repeat protein
LVTIGLALGFVLCDQERYPDALRVYHDLLDQDLVRVDYVRVCISAGSVLNRLSQWEDALWHFLQALDRVLPRGEEALAARIHHGLGACYRKVHDRDAAYQHTMRAHELYPVRTLPWYETLHNLGTLELDRGHPLRALASLRECWTYYQQAGAARDAGLVAEELARCYYVQGNLVAAQTQIRQGLSGVVGLYHHEAGRLFLLLAACSWEAGELHTMELAYLAGRACLGADTGAVLATLFPEVSDEFVSACAYVGA